jgi:hypothetical protein
MITYERPISHAARWARHLARLAFGIFIAALCAHRFGSLSTSTFVALALLATALALLAVLLSVIGFVRLWQVAAVGGIASLVALIYAAVPLSAAGLALSQVLSKPALTEVSTDSVTPPPFIRDRPVEAGWLTPAAPLPADRVAQAQAYPGLSGRRYDGALDRVLAGVRSVAEQSGITIVAEEGLENAEPDFEDLAARAGDASPADADAPPLGPTGRKGAKGAARDPGPVPNLVPTPMPRPKPEAAASTPGRRADDLLLQGESRSRIAGFRFDLVIRLREEAETTVVDIRVASRIGPHDLGLNAATADSFLQALDAELLGIAGD